MNYRQAVEAAINSVDFDPCRTQTEMDEITDTLRDLLRFLNNNPEGQRQ